MMPDYMSRDLASPPGDRTKFNEHFGPWLSRYLASGQSVRQTERKIDQHCISEQKIGWHLELRLLKNLAVFACILAS